MTDSRAEIGVFGGSGFYQWLGAGESVAIETPFGSPSAPLAIATVAGKRIAFLPRHGVGHKIPPHAVNYRANLWAMRELGVRRIIAPSAVGSLRAGLRPGELVICDQFVDRTRARVDTFYSGPEVVHVSAAEPYCPELRRLAARAAAEQGILAHESGTIVVVEGPRFSTRAESRWFGEMGWDVVGMTQYPEVVLARELEICYLGLALVTDYDVGVEGLPEVKPVEAREVVRVLEANIGRVRRLLAELIPAIPEIAGCECQRALDAARM